MYELLQLENFKDFRCIGDKCPDNCCHSWKVYINKATYKKYKKDKLIKTENLILAKKPTSNLFAEIKLKEDGNCPFLDDSGLCDIHKNYGKNMLSNVCKIYPQKLTKYNKRLEKTVKLSCPASVDLLFKSKDPIEFNLTVEDKFNSVITNDEDRDNCNGLRNEDYFALRSLAITILQYREINIKERLYMLGRVCDIVNNLVESKEYEAAEIRAYIDELELTFKSDEQLKIKESYIFECDEKYELFVKMTPLIKDFVNESSNKNKTKFYEIIKMGLEDIDNIVAEDIKRFKNNVLDKFFLENDYILEHYLVCKVFEEVFPKNSTSIKNAFNLLVNKLLMLYIYLIILYKGREKMDLDDFKNVLYFFERQVSHSEFKNNIINNLNNFMQMDWNILLELIF